MNKYSIIACLIVCLLPFSAQAQSPMEPKPVEGHETPSWVNATGARGFSESDLKEHIDSLQYNINAKELQADKSGNSQKNCKAIKNGLNICKKE